MIQLKKVKVLPAREQVASILRKAILSRELQEGQEITLEEIASLASVSGNLFLKNKVIFNEKKDRAVKEICTQVSFIK